MNFKSHLRMFAIATLGAFGAVSVNLACAQDKGTVVPVDTASKTIRIAIDVETLNVEVVEPKGARPCVLCSAQLQDKYGKSCEKAGREVNICQGLVSATVQDLNHITILRSSKNPYCVTISSGTYGGTDVVRQLCFCTAADQGKCPAAAWYQ